jgi:tetratricopeptide (TPR) repeat protein
MKFLESKDYIERHLRESLHNDFEVRLRVIDKGRSRKYELTVIEPIGYERQPKEIILAKLNEILEEIDYTHLNICLRNNKLQLVWVESLSKQQPLSKQQGVDYQKEVEDYTQALEINPINAQAYYNRADAKYRLGQYQEAVEDYTKAFAIDRVATSKQFPTSLSVQFEKLVELKSKGILSDEEFCVMLTKHKNKLNEEKNIRDSIQYVLIALACIAGLTYVGYDQLIVKPCEYQKGIEEADARIKSEELRRLYAISEKEEEPEPRRCTIFR